MPSNFHSKQEVDRYVLMHSASFSEEQLTTVMSLQHRVSSKNETNRQTYGQGTIEMIEENDMSEKIVNFDKLNNLGTKQLLSGRTNGEAAFSYYKLEAFTRADILVLKSTGNIVVTHSYFLGMLEGVFNLYEEVDDLHRHIDCTGLSPLNKEELARGIKRGFSRNASPFM